MAKAKFKKKNFLENKPVDSGAVVSDFDRIIHCKG